MKKITLVALCALSALLLGSCSQKDTIRIISYNIRLSGVDDGTNSWQYRKQATLNMIAEEQPTLFGLQEATPEQMAFLVENLPQYGHIGVGREDGVADGEHMSIFYLLDEVELLDGGTFWLSETPDTPSIGWDAAYKRTCTWTKLRMRSSGKEFAYLNTHLDHVGKEAQREGLALMVERCREIVPEGMT
ncbi:MAG: endonuclease/exonuclease/phosphatase family protein, partial [Tidjanibacter sp.]|nr:endonuclease/exonuclease/phosphatase family protein [Tidjanibacter sp.]